MYCRCFFKHLFSRIFLCFVFLPNFSQFSLFKIKVRNSQTVQNRCIFTTFKLLIYIFHRNVGQLAGNLINDLVNRGSSYKDFHILGASLGAHVAGYAGFYTKGQVGRITGLDPSGPLFHSVSNPDKLDSTDAKFVDIIHTAGRWVGNTDPSGHVDFYANDGLAPQPGCQGRESIDLLCSHLRAWKIFEDSIEGSEFYAIQCPTFQDFESGSCCDNGNLVAILGDQTRNNTRGIFYFYTNSVKPFVMGRKLSINCYS